MLTHLKTACEFGFLLSKDQNLYVGEFVELGSFGSFANIKLPDVVVVPRCGCSKSKKSIKLT